MLRCRSMVSPADTKDMLQGRSMASQFADVGRFSPCMLWLRSMVPVAGTKDMLLGWSIPSRIEDGGWFSPCMLWLRSMVPVAGTKDMLQGRSMASRIEDGGWFSPCMLWFRSMVPVAGTKDMLQGRSMASRIVDVARFIACMLWSGSMVPFGGTTGMLLGWSMVSRTADTGRFVPQDMFQGVSMMPQSPGFGKLSMLINASRQKRGVPDRGHKNSYFSLMLGLVILAMAAQCFSSCIYAIVASWNDRYGNAYLLVSRAALIQILSGITVALVYIAVMTQEHVIGAANWSQFRLGQLQR
jgi:hypothetical protein